MVTDAILDTSILIDLLRAFLPATSWFAGLGDNRWPLRRWLDRDCPGRDGSGEARSGDSLPAPVSIEHPTEDDNRWAMRRLASFHLSHGVQLQDAMIASVAVHLAVPLYTANLKHFRPLPSVDANKPY